AMPPQPLALRTWWLARGWAATLGPAEASALPLPLLFLSLPFLSALSLIGLSWVRSRDQPWRARHAGARTRNGSAAGARPGGSPRTRARAGPHRRPGRPAQGPRC